MKEHLPAEASLRIGPLLPSLLHLDRGRRSLRASQPAGQPLKPIVSGTCRLADRLMRCSANGLAIASLGDKDAFLSHFMSLGYTTFRHSKVPGNSEIVA